MAAVGRGRGRGRGALGLNKDRRPGEATGSKNEQLGASKDTINELTSLVSSLSVYPDEIQIEKIKSAVEKAATDSKKLEDVVSLIYKRSLSDWRCSSSCAEVSLIYKRSFSDWRCSSSCAEVCNSLLHIHCDGTKFRDIVLRTIQADFKNKDILRRESPARYLSCVAFMCQVFKRLRDEKGQPFVPMCGPVTESLESLLDNKASNEEILCACTQLLDIGVLLHEHGDKTRLGKLRPVLREKILDLCGTKESRLLMVNIIECFASDWTMHKAT